MGGRNQIIRATPTNEYAPKPNKQIRITNMGGRNQIIRANPTNGYAPQVRIRIQIQAKKSESESKYRRSANEYPDSDIWMFHYPIFPTGIATGLLKTAAVHWLIAVLCCGLGYFLLSKSCFGISFFCVSCALKAVRSLLLWHSALARMHQTKVSRPTIYILGRYLRFLRIGS